MRELEIVFVVRVVVGKICCATLETKQILERVTFYLENESLKDKIQSRISTY